MRLVQITEVMYTVITTSGMMVLKVIYQSNQMSLIEITKQETEIIFSSKNKVYE